MNDAAQLALPLVAFAASWLALSPVALLAFRAARPLLARLEARQQSTLLFALACLPLGVALLVALLGFAPGVGGWVVDRHCHAEGCWPHVPALHGGATGVTLLGAALLTAGGTSLWLLGAGLRRRGAHAAMLGMLGDSAEGTSGLARPRFKVIQSGEPWAACVGWLRPELLVSRALLQRLSAAQLDAVLVHEAAHAARLDNLRRLLAGVSLCLLPRRSRREMQRALASADERACDHEAALRMGGRDPVIDALLALLPDARAAGEPLSAAERIAALRAGPKVALPCAGAQVLACLVYTACTLAAVRFAHHGSERLLAWLSW